MKNTMLLTIPALLALASVGWVAEYDPCPEPNHGFCYWPGGGCYSLNTGKPDTPSRCSSERAGCVADGYLYYDVEYPADEYGEGNTCEELGGVWSGVGNDPNFNDGVPLWCKWPTGCESIKNDKEKENCEENGTVFKDVSASGIGKGKTCQGGEWTGEGRDPDAVMLGCCNWKGEGCFAVWDEAKWATCKTAERWLTCDNDEAGTCPAEGGPPSSSSVAASVPSSSSVAVVVSSSSSVVVAVSSSSSAAVAAPSSSSLREYAYCVFVSTQECYEGPHTTCPTSALLQDTCPYNLSSSATAVTSSSSGLSSSSSSSSSSSGVSGSSSSGGVSSSSQTYAYCVYVEDRMCLPWRYSPCPGGGIDNDTCPYNSSSSGVNSPILSHYQVRGNVLVAMQNAVNLQSAGNVTVQVFSLKGKVVRTLRFSQGSYMVPLSGLPKGLYIVRASGVSWKRTVKVAVK
jgi:hypothetical protein